mgnify:CR=1 FL=1
MSKLKLKRGPENTRNSNLFESGEFVITTDEHNLYYGDGTTMGGVPVAANFRSIEWEFTSVKDQAAYTSSNSSESTVSFPISSSGVFLVFYGSAKMKKSDYTLTSSALTFTTAPQESGLPITIVYVGV